MDYFFSSVADYELFCINDLLSDGKSKLKIPYVNKTFQKKPEHFCSLHLYITNEIFFCQRLVLHTCKKYRDSIKEARVSFALFSFKWRVLCYLSLRFVLCKFGKTVIWELQLEIESCTEEFSYCIEVAVKRKWANRQNSKLPCFCAASNKSGKWSGCHAQNTKCKQMATFL